MPRNERSNTPLPVDGRATVGSLETADGSSAPDALGAATTSFGSGVGGRGSVGGFVGGTTFGGPPAPEEGGTELVSCARNADGMRRTSVIRRVGIKVRI